MTAGSAVRVHRWRGAAAVTLRSGELQATFLPELNLLGTSIRVGGEEFLALPGGVNAYRRGHTTGLPLLGPWANRLGARAYRSGRVAVDLEGLPLHVDANGLPIHGTLSAHDGWEIVGLSTSPGLARLHARFDYDRAELLAAFPFPHRLEAVIEASGDRLSIATSLTPTGRRAVPISFGYHPYLRLPHGHRSQWRLGLPRRSRVELDARGLPTGRRTPASAESNPIGERTFDDLFELTDGRTLTLEGRGRRIRVEYGSGYRFAQVFVPPGKAFVCLEPMTAPTNALVTGGYDVVRPGRAFTARLRIRVETTT